MYLGDQVKNPCNHFFQHEPFARKKTGFRIQGFPVTICRKQFNLPALREYQVMREVFRAFFVVKGTQCSPSSRLPASPCAGPLWSLLRDLLEIEQMETWRHSNCRFLWMNVPSKEGGFWKHHSPKDFKADRFISLLWFSWCFVGKNRRQSTQVASQFTVTSASGFKSFVEFCSSLECKKKSTRLFCCLE